MSIKELDRLKVLEQLDQKLINQKLVGDFLGISTRQIRRLIYEHEGIGKSLATANSPFLRLSRSKTDFPKLR